MGRVRGFSSGVWSFAGICPKCCTFSSPSRLFRKRFLITFWIRQISIAINLYFNASDAPISKIRKTLSLICLFCCLMILFHYWTPSFTMVLLFWIPKFIGQSYDSESCEAYFYLSFRWFLSRLCHKNRLEVVATVKAGI